MLSIIYKCAFPITQMDTNMIHNQEVHSSGIAPLTQRDSYLVVKQLLATKP